MAELSEPKGLTGNQPAEAQASVLLVDDQPANLLALWATLETLGLNLVEARSGDEALRRSQETEFAVVLLDVQMPGLDGFETARLIRAGEASRRTPIIFLTAYDSDRFPVEQAYSLGAVDYLVKPLNPVIVRAKVMGFVDLFEKTQQVKQQAEQIRQLERTGFEQRLAEENARLRASEAALRESEEKFRLMADSIPQLAWMARPDGHIFWYNRRWYEYTGTTAEQMEGWGWQNVHDPAELPQVLERWKGSIASSKPFNMVFPLRGADAVFRPFLTRVMPLRAADGSMRYWFGTNTDISEIREAQEELQQRVERLRLLNESAAHLLHATNPDEMVRGLFERVKDHLGVDTYFNFMVNEAGDALRKESCAGIPEEEARQITRLEFGEAICGTVALERRPIVATSIQQSDDPKAQLVKGFGIDAYACNPLMAGDRLLGTLSFASHTKDRFGDDELEFIRTLCHYVTVAYERLRLVNELREADRRKDEFLAMLAHELRNPLAPIRNALQILRMRNTDGVTAEKAREMMERQLQHLVRLVDDLLDVSRIMRNKIELRKERLDLRQVVERAGEMAQPVIDAQGHELTVRMPAKAVPVEVDSVRLAQVIANLLSNAAKYSERAGRIWLSLEGDGESALLRVKDSGSGIPPELLPKVFDLFVQGDRSSARTQGGLGIGLTLVKRLVEMHGGRVAAYSKGFGKGSEFVVYLPLAPASDGGPAASNGEQTVEARGRRVLVVDDNVDAAESLAILLRLMRHDVRTVHDGPAALEAIKAYQPELVLLDIGLPGMDGYAVARRLRLMPGGQAVRLVAVSGYGQEEDRRRAHDAGFDQHLTKPVDPAALESLFAF